MPTFHIYWADKRPPENQRAVADAVSRAMAALDEAMITGPEDVTFWFHRFSIADIYLNGVSLGPADPAVGPPSFDPPDESD